MHAPPAPTPSPESSFRAAPSALNREAMSADPYASAYVNPVDTQPSELVIRPKGLRHGKWEAPAWAFWAVGGAILLFAIVYALGRVGVIDVARFRKKNPG
jgi:hypothetical protein